MKWRVNDGEVFGLVRSFVDAHSLGLSAVEQLLSDCGFRVVTATEEICKAADRPEKIDSANQIAQWLTENRISRLGFSYRLDVDNAVRAFGQLVYQLKEKKFFSFQGGPLAGLYFAGLPYACEKVEREFGEMVRVFNGDDSPHQTLEKLGIDPGRLKVSMESDLTYDRLRWDFAENLVKSAEYLSERPSDRSAYKEFGSEDDTLLKRLAEAGRKNELPLFRAHVGPYSTDRMAALHEYSEWCRRLARSGFLDILSVGTSQLTQSRFGEDWEGQPNGGGVPINSPEEFAAVWQAARPMLVRTYAGTKAMPALAEMYEKSIRNAWHTFSFWWFCKLDGRGPLSLRDNLKMHFETLKLVATFGKPFEPNVPHHFAFRGADDLTYILSAILSARAAKKHGIKTLVLQIMLNTPKHTWGLQDLAKARVILKYVRALEDSHFRVVVQPRAGLDYFSADPTRAKTQLACVSAMMDDIEPELQSSPEIVHVVSYSEASHLADPAVVDESIQITKRALKDYRSLKRQGKMPSADSYGELHSRTAELSVDIQRLLESIERHVKDPYSENGFYEIFQRGYLPVPYLWECREEFPEAIRWPTRVIRGSTKIVDAEGRAVSTQERIRAIENQTLAPKLIQA